ncbi:MAG: hypothetical protein AB1761_12860 [Pseudomonadota bacterium]
MRIAPLGAVLDQHQRSGARHDRGARVGTEVRSNRGRSSPQFPGQRKQLRDLRVRVSRKARFGAPHVVLTAYFSDRGRLFQFDRGRRFSVIVDGISR